MPSCFQANRFSGMHTDPVIHAAIGFALHLRRGSLVGELGNATSWFRPETRYPVDVFGRPESRAQHDQSTTLGLQLESS